jgi:hypothetical protein
MYTELDFNEHDLPQKADPEKDVERARILILEDDLTFKPLWMNAIKLSCPEAHVDWVQAEEAAERCIKVRRKLGQKYDLVVADIFLSGRKTGIDLWSKFGDVIENFIFVSSLPREKFDVLISAEEYAYPIYLQKPLRAATCADLIKQLLGKS